MAEHRWAVIEATGEFLYGGKEPYDCVPGLSPGQIRVVLASAPDQRTQRYDPASPTLIRGATATEMAAWDAARKDEDANRELGLKAFRALAQATFELKSNNWTGAQFKARIKEIYKAL